MLMQYCGKSCQNWLKIGDNNILRTTTILNTENNWPCFYSDLDSDETKRLKRAKASCNI